MTISAPFARTLAAGRTQFNQRVTEAQRRFPGFDRAAFSSFLTGSVDSVVRAVDATAPDRVASVVLAAYDLALELAGHGLTGPQARSPMVDQAWREVAPQYARLIAEYPVEMLGSLSNAAVNISQHASVRGSQWLQDMAILSPHVESLRHFQALGQLLAWRSGMAHFRTGAIAAADALPGAAVMAALGASAGDWPALRERLIANPWWSATPVPHPGRDVGSFTGFGGEFAEPPQIRPCPGGFVVRCGARYFHLVADACGAILHAATRDEFDSSDASPCGKVAIRDARLVINGRDIDVDLPPNAFAAVCNEHTVAVTSVYTHSIRLLPLQ